MSLKSHLLLTATRARGVVGMLLVLTVMATPALAWDHHGHHRDNCCDDRDGCGPPISAPEIDLGSMLGGMTLLVGGAFILADRRCRSKPRVGLN
ncbi:hypothetical protein SAMN05444166_2792 [Singulisphaera sp. GP187]|uniref:hypothetical protein n=1 Tax=Singulisphaera sp. GP187 TaxID=1882752 RepID=UPI00092C1525|nr:hypothetical protein [Singulisphaera sp. GP187]SIO16709.1 hypothetical protein SAMN05444166_2792 [Singulisphaera sp. GP187]